MAPVIHSRKGLLRASCKAEPKTAHGAFAALKMTHNLNDKDLAFFRSSVPLVWAGRELLGYTEKLGLETTQGKDVERKHSMKVVSSGGSIGARL